MFYENVKLNQDITNLSRRIADQNEALAILGSNLWYDLSTMHPMRGDHLVADADERAVARGFSCSNLRAFKMIEQSCKQKQIHGYDREIARLPEWDCIERINQLGEMISNEPKAGEFFRAILRNFFIRSDRRLFIIQTTGERGYHSLEQTFITLAGKFCGWTFSTNPKDNLIGKLMLFVRDLECLELNKVLELAAKDYDKINSTVWRIKRIQPRIATIVGINVIGANKPKELCSNERMLVLNAKPKIEVDLDFITQYRTQLWAESRLK